MSTKTYTLAVVAMLFSFSSAVHAGILDSNGNAIVGFTGTSPFDSGEGLDGTIDFAVFTKAGFASEFPASGFLPNASDNFVYTYQVLNNGPGTDFISAQIIAPVAAAAQGAIGAFDIAADIDPGIMTFLNDSAQWIFTGAEGQIENNFNSSILVYSSPFSPTGGFSVTINGGTSASTSAPVPGALIPEPASVLLAAAGFAALGLRRRS